MTEDELRAVVARIGRERFLAQRDGSWADMLLAALKEAGLVVEQDWQPIETAPRDGTLIMAWEPSYYQGKGGHEFALFQDGEWWSLRAWTIEPIAWRPLPAPPATGDAP